MYAVHDGYLPDYGTLLNAIAAGTVTAQDVMQAAVKANRLPKQTLSDRGYRWALSGELDGLRDD